MFDLESIRELYRHMEWADASLWNAVLASGPAREDQVIRERLLHIHRTQQYFLKVWMSREIDFSDRGGGQMHELLDSVDAYYAEVREFLLRTSDEDLTRNVPVPWADRYKTTTGEPAAAVTLAETLFQVSAHSAFHRAQVNTRLREVGGKPPLIDYIAWVWSGRPGAPWPEL